MHQKNYKKKLIMTLKPLHDQETLEIIQKVSDKIAKKYVFLNHDLEDIKQECFILCTQAIPRYNGSIPLEHFLLCHLSNRLKNLKRDRANTKHSKILYAASLDYVPDEDPAFLVGNEEEELFAEKELRSKIDKNLPAEYRKDYLALIAGQDIPLGRKTKIRSIIRTILSPTLFLEENDG